MAAQIPSKPPISTHILDTSRGYAATGVEVILSKWVNDSWLQIKKSHTNNDGRCDDLIERQSFEHGRFKLYFNVGKYFAEINTETIFPFIEIIFEVPPSKSGETNHYHIPLLLNPFGYSTYRGT